MTLGSSASEKPFYFCFIVNKYQILIIFFVISIILCIFAQNLIDMNRYNWNEELLREAVINNVNYSDVLRTLGIPIRGNNLTTLKHKIKLYDINTSHFTGKREVYGIFNRTYRKAEEYLNSDKYITASNLKEKLILEGYKENKCEICGISEWQGKPINCQLHHIDGNHNNNKLENLQILCPNCHSQTDNYCGNANIDKTINYCPDCGKEINKMSKYCKVCAAKHRENTHVENYPNKEELITKYLESGSFQTVGKFYNVTGNAVRKWFKGYGLPYYASELRKLYKNQCNEQWLWCKGNSKYLRQYQEEHFKKAIQIDELGNIIKIYNNRQEILEDNLNPSRVYEVCRGKLKTHHKKRFKYLED